MEAGRAWRAPGPRTQARIAPQQPPAIGLVPVLHLQLHHKGCLHVALDQTPERFDLHGPDQPHGLEPRVAAAESGRTRQVQLTTRRAKHSVTGCSWLIRTGQHV